jgi:hypothetical protein
VHEEHVEMTLRESKWHRREVIVEKVAKRVLGDWNFQSTKQP